MYQLRITPCIESLPPVGQWVQVFLAGHDHVWLRGRLESIAVWELDTKQEGFPDFVLVSDELITHWADELPSPFDMRPNVEPITIEGKVVEKSPAPALPSKRK